MVLYNIERERTRVPDVIFALSYRGRAEADGTAAERIHRGIVGPRRKDSDGSRVFVGERSLCRKRARVVLIGVVVRRR